MTARKLLLLAAISLVLPVVIALEARAITFGKEVLNARFEYPTVLSIWYQNSSYSEFEHMCTGTLIEPRIVLTAAHCVLPKGIIQVGYGGDTIESGQRQSVSAVWKHPGFSEKALVNDVGLLLLEKPINSISPTPLIPSSALAKMMKNRNSLLEVVGWGKDQNGEDAFYLRKATVVDESSKLQKAAKWWRNDVWIAAGKYNKKEKVYAGACNGDSGGPLFVNLNGDVAVAGVVSFGIAEECETYLPSVFSRMSYYTRVIQQEGIVTLLRNESTQNRSLPSVVTEPRIIGLAKTGQTLSCDKGAWSANTSQVSVLWSGVGVPFGTSGSSITLSENTSGNARTFTCTVRGSNANGSTQRVLTVSQPTKPISSISPVINGFPASASATSVTVSCTPGTFSGATTVNQEWWIGDSYSPTSKIASGNSYAINQNFFVSYGGKNLYCLSFASGDGGNASSTSRGVLIPSFQKPQVQTFPTVSGVKEWQSPAINTVASCAGWAWKSPVTQEVIEWYSNSTYSLTGATKVGTGTTLILTENFLTTYKSKYLMCAVSGTNLGGTMTMYDGLYLYYYPSATPTPTPTPTRTSTPSPTPSPTNPITSVKPNAPFNFTGIIGTSSVALSWTFPGGNGLAITDFVIERSTSTSGWIVLNDGVNTEIRFTDTGLSPGTRYDYRVRAYNGYNYSDYSSTISASIPVAATPTPTPTPIPTPTPTINVDRIAPEGSSWNVPSAVYPGGAITVSFKATDNVGVTSATAILLRGSEEVSRHSMSRMPALADFYSASVTFPANASGSYGMRFEALDAAGNKYSREFANTNSIIDKPVYSGAGHAVTKSGSTETVSAGDIFTCNVGDWLYKLDSRYPITCEWVTTSGNYRGTTLTITSAMLTIDFYTVRVILRVNDGSPVTGAWTTWFRLNQGAYESRSDFEFYSKTFRKGT
jgi:hypothetical protein